MSDRSESSHALHSEDGKARVDQIADAALRLFARYGYKRSSMGDIAREAGLAKATLYLHFKGKDDVFRAMLDLIGRRVEARCRDVLAAPAPFGVRLRSLLEAYYGQVYASFGTGEHLVELKSVMTSIAGPQLQTLELAFQRFAEQLCRQAKDAGEIALGEADITTDDWIAGLMFAAIGAKMGQAPSCEAYAGRLGTIARVFTASAAVAAQAR